MKKFLIGILLMMCLNGLVHAQSGTPPISNDSLAVQSLQKVGATTAQIQQFMQTKHSFAQQVKAVRQSTTIPDEQKKIQIKQLNDQKNAAYKQILGAEKYKEYNRVKNETPVEE